MADDELHRLRFMRLAIDRLHKEMDNAGGLDRYWVQAVEDAIGIANGETRSPAEYVEVPVMRRARVTLVYREHLRAGDRFVVRSSPSATFRSGIGVAGPGTLGDLLGRIPSACPGDLVYRVESE